jgi:tetratricopeptide (TPR) repeat protein
LFSKYYNEAAQSIDEKNYSQGIEKLSKALSYQDQAANNYKIADAYFYRGFCRSKLKSYSAALADMDAGLKIKADYVKGFRMKAAVYFDSKDYEKCILWCDKGLEKKPNDFELSQLKSQSLFQQKKFDAAKPILLSIVEADPKNTDAIRFLGAVALRQKKYDSSVVYYSKALEVDPLDFISYYDRGIARSYLEDSTGARLDMEKAMRLDTGTKYVGYNNLGFFLKIEKKDYAGSIPYFNKALELFPNFGVAYSNRGFAELELNDMKSAYRDIKKAIELDKTNSYAYKNMGLYYLKDNKKKNACDYFKKAQELGYTEEYDDEVEKLLKEHCK